jgi:hypothetical protein
VRRLLIVTLAVLVTALPRVADAQGRGRPKGPKSTPPGAAAGSSTTGEAAANTAAASTFRQFGVWLDDASAPTRGVGRVGIGAGYWRATAVSFVDVPIVDVAYGVHHRLQLAATVPFYQSTYAGTTLRGLDDVYLSGKIIGIDPASSRSRIGLAVSPVLEILSAGYTDDRVHWALPVSLELRTSPVRVYGSAGYFSRGAAFGGAAVEWTTPAGTVITGGLTQSFSTSDNAIGPSGGRSDVSVSVAHALTDLVAAYISVGRSLSSPDDNATTLGISGGLSLTFSSGTASP